jgi:dolichyl-phosphate-mannose-protein mannosyltransferase
MLTRDLCSFGGFASKYIKGKFFMDVHPPLAKLLLTLAGWLAGFDGEFDFKDIGKDYVEPGVPYVAMRMLPAICGILLVPTMFLTLKAAGCRTMTAAMGAGLIVFGMEFPLGCKSTANHSQRTVSLPKLD